MRSIVLTILYVPGDRPDRFGSAASSGADAVVIDWEDAVAADAKDAARRASVEYLSARAPVPVRVRINPLDSPSASADLAALSGLTNLSGIVVPKIESAGQLDVLRTALPGVPIHPMIESARAVLQMSAIAAATGVATISLGLADLASDLGVQDDQVLAWIGVQAVLAARAARLPPPLMPVFTSLTDQAGLAAACRVGRSRGFLGGEAIHPRQIPTIVEAFTPDDEEVGRARDVLHTLDEAARSGASVGVLADGRMVDPAMRVGAERVLALTTYTRAAR